MNQVTCAMVDFNVNNAEVRVSEQNKRADISLHNDNMDFQVVIISIYQDNTP